MTTPEFDVDFELKERVMDEAPIGITISDVDREDNPLVYVNDAFERLTGYSRNEVLGRNCRFLQGKDTDPEAVTRLREAIKDEESVTVELVNYRADGERFWNEVTVAPIRDKAGDVTHFAGFQADVTARREAELETQQRKENLERLVSRVNGLMQDVTETLMRATSREENEREVAERIVDTDPYVFAWFGEPDTVAGTIDPTSWAGAGSVEGVSINLDAEDPTAEAFATRSLQLTTDIERTACADRVPDARSMAAVPIAYGDTVYGVLSVYADDPDTFDEHELIVVETLGRTIGTAINAAQSRRTLTADNIVELEFEIRDRDLFFVDLSAQCDCRLEYRGSVYRSGGSFSMFFSTDASLSMLSDCAVDHPDVEDVTLVSGADAGLFEFRINEGSIISELAERGAKTQSITAESGTAHLGVEVSADADSRTVSEWLTGTYADTELTAYRERERPPTTRREFIEDVENNLTDRQLTALQRAYLSGYYESNRTTTGEELAASMDISRSTFHQHLRAAERKLIGEFFAR
ncbi:MULTISPECIES: bacterio-opsin activator domain-containing protein [Halobacterium]|uniref:bacterio-opsin activator domain-containing protein n=1 Tax=Halobacterium TaxID=2239 RepID=UPI00073E5A4C|nr:MULTISPECIES: bacterio-opsin activator domain-containing protein [Halobacterium]MCG1002128.1 PAS domain-containing protein [Halobacterium noricense]